MLHAFVYKYIIVHCQANELNDKIKKKFKILKNYLEKINKSSFKNPRKRLSQILPLKTNHPNVTSQI